MNISEIANLICAQPNQCTTEIKWLLTDSRSLSFPENTLFFGLRTQRNDGHKFIPELYKRGVRHFVVNQTPIAASEMPDAIFLETKDTLRALQQVAAIHRHNFNMPTIGITGSNGKTIVKEWLYQLLRDDKQITRSPRSYNSQIGVALSVWQINENTEMGIFEAGISERGEMQRLQEIIDPSIGIFTNIADAHQENFDSIEEKCAEKIKLFTNVKVLIYNVDCKPVHHSAQAQFLPAFTWGRNELATVQLMNTSNDKQHTSIAYKYNGETHHYKLAFSDKASIENSMQCLCCMLHLGYEPQTIAERMLRLENLEMRLEVKKGRQNCLIINDSYNSDLASLNIALDFLEQQAQNQERKKTIILSDILQNGQSEKVLYQTVAKLLANRQIEQIIGIGEQISAYQNAFEACNAVFYTSTEEFLERHPYREFSNQIILLKGSRKFKFERISSKLEMIVHETTLEVNMSALVHNFNYFRNKLKPETKTMGMVKAFAYGSGAIETAQTLQHHGCQYLAVAVADEGAELRKNGIHVPIVVMDPYPSAFNTIFEHNLEPEIYSFNLLNEFMLAADKQGISNYPVHIKIDSGMHRLGFEPTDMKELSEWLLKQNTIRVSSIFSHLAGADEAIFDAFTQEQINTFDACAKALENALPYPILKHILNSAGSERFTEYQYDMVRLGIGYYGISASNNAGMQNVCSLKSVILQIKNVKAGESIGYSRKTILTKDSIVGVMPIGYADGLDRKLGNSVGEVWVNGTRCKILGNVCMDLAMIDLTNTTASEGDQVEIFGEHISLCEVAEKIGTISYEVLTGISRRVKRIYYQE